MFDFSEYQSKIFYLTNKKVAGKMKDVYKGKPIHKFIWLKSKMHCILSDDGKESNTTKKLNIAIEFNEYKDNLFNKKVMRHKMRRIQSKKHKTGTYQVNKISLPCFNDKRFILDDSVHTLAYSHKGQRKF